MKLAFIISLPRSGSTLLQRILVGNKDISTVSEPWLLLPFAGLSEYSEVKTYSEYSYRVAHLAYSDFINNLPKGYDDYRLSLADFITDLYSKANINNSKIFLDKTPRYYLIVDFIRSLFPESKIIFLVRNPLDVMSSMIDTWWGGRLWLNHQYIDLYKGPQCIHDSYFKYKESSLLVSYENLVANPEYVIKNVCSYLEVEYSGAMLENIGKVRLSGEMGDPTGVAKYNKMSTDSVGEWKNTFDNVVRRRFARRYLDSIGRDVLSTFNFDTELQAQCFKDMPSHVNVAGSCRDLLGLVQSTLSRKLCLKIIKEQISSKNCCLLD